MGKKKLETVYPIEAYETPLAAYIGELIESLPHEQRLYPDLYANDLARKVQAFVGKSRDKA